MERIANYYTISYLMLALFIIFVNSFGNTFGTITNDNYPKSLTLDQISPLVITPLGKTLFVLFLISIIITLISKIHRNTYLFSGH